MRMAAGGIALSAVGAWALILASGCTGAAAGGDDRSTGTDAVTLAVVDDLPTCNPSREGIVYYRQNDGQFFFCNGSSMISLDLSGMDGADGTSWVVVTSEADDAACPESGILIAMGPDADGDGVIDAVRSTAAVCDGKQGPEGPAGPPGADGEDGINALTRLFQEPPGSNCQSGGERIEIGLDTNGNGVLDDDEVNPASTGYVCNGITSACGALIQCGSLCVDVLTDESNCGDCNVACGLGEVCVGGACEGCDSSLMDCDGDGWMVGDGDCCDQPGSCGSQPELVNPGAIEVVGNGVDDNCNSLTDLFDLQDTVPCDASIPSDSSDPIEYAKAMGICRTTTEEAAPAERTWGLISASLGRADGTPLTFADGKSIRPAFGTAIPPLEGASLVVLSTGLAADGTQTDPGPNGGPAFNPSTSHGGTPVDIQACTESFCVSDWFSTENLPLKSANQLPTAPDCGSGSSGSPNLAHDSVMLVLRMRAPTNAQAFSFNAYFFSSEYPEFVCSSYNDQLIALVDTPTGSPPIPNPVDKNLMTYSSNGVQWPIGINVAAGTGLFSVCESEITNPECWDSSVSSGSCELGEDQLASTGFESGPDGCTRGGGTYWLTTTGNVIPGEEVTIRIAIWDVGDSVLDSLTLIDGFRWLAVATLPGTS